MFWMQPSRRCSIPFSIQNQTSCLDFQYFLSVSNTGSLCVSIFFPLVSVLFVSVSLWLSLSLFLCSVEHGQRTAAEQPWWVSCKATEKHLINLPSLWLYFSSSDPKTQPFVFFTLFSLNTFIIPHTAAQMTISVPLLFFYFLATQTLNVNVGSQFVVVLPDSQIAVVSDWWFCFKTIAKKQISQLSAFHRCHICLLK